MLATLAFVEIESRLATFQAAIVMTLRQGFSARREQLATALEPCGSPIEARFLIGLICACTLHDYSIVVTDSDGDEEIFVSEGPAWGGQALDVTPQEQIAGYRVDFGLCLVCENVDFAIAKMVGKPEPVAPRTIELRLAVESVTGMIFTNGPRRQSEWSNPVSHMSI